MLMRMMILKRKAGGTEGTRDGLISPLQVCLALHAVAPWMSHWTTRFEASAVASGWWIGPSWRSRSCALSGTGRPGHRAKKVWDAQPASVAILARVGV